ncbi:receptor-like protein EIX2 [Humulus lupulus]|uniref:receptor-like protein EIX2 n=1 Tax=Humulus lupulus TaxID=3486 RepID=UPI002B40A363|nr:receptor-like protein EIX2 [Humulus lupulus]
MMTRRVVVVVWFVIATSGVWSSTSTSSANSQSQCIEKERRALLEFKQALVYKSNFFLSSWTNTGRDDDCCTWRGIRCDNSTHHIIMLNLRPNNSDQTLGGEIGHSLHELQHLSYLDLSHNNFTKIPKFIGSLSRLTYLNLSYNPIVGIIPSQLGNLTRLKFLDLYIDLDYGHLIDNNSFEWLSRLTSLESFKLRNTDLTKASTNWLQRLKTLPSLSNLRLSHCLFPPVDISSLSTNSSNSLTELLILRSVVHPSTVPWLFNISSSLVYLVLYDSQIEGTLPNSSENMRSLEAIYLPSNEFEGEVPKSLGSLCNLQELVLDHNRFSTTLGEILESLSGCAKSSLEHLELSNNRIKGPFPTSNVFPIFLRYLGISSNQIEGPLSSLSMLPNIIVLTINSNKLNGTLPESIGQLQHLESFDFSLNSFTGTVSEIHFHKLSKLKEVYISENSLTFNFNSNWVPPFSLKSLKLRSCKLGPEFPSWLQTQSNITILDIANTGIHGTIPAWFSNHASKLNLLNLSSNQFLGPIPHFLSAVQDLHLSNNHFVSLRDFICNKAVHGATQFLDVSNNLIFGNLPNCWGNIKSLKFLMVDNNKLSGVVPSSIGLLYDIQYLVLRYNNFSGSLPSSIQNCTQLQVLNVEENSLEGEIPTWIGERLTNLIILGLRSNKFHGSIPSNLCHIRSIQILDLSMNDLTGAIPSCTNNFTYMRNKDYQELVLRHTYVVERSSDAVAYVVNDTVEAQIMWKGKYYEFQTNLKLLKIIDLSSNKLDGQIPEELTNLVELVQLNLSRNNLYGPIPIEIGKLSNLQALDLSNNKLSGTIPTTLEKMSFLQHLDFSNNKLSGKIPTATQLQSFDDSAFAGNLGLCGAPLTKSCSEDKTLHGVQESEQLFDMSWLQMGVGVGFGVGFAGVCMWSFVT